MIDNIIIFIFTKLNKLKEKISIFVNKFRAPALKISSGVTNNKLNFELTNHSKTTKYYTITNATLNSKSAQNVPRGRSDLLPKSNKPSSFNFDFEIKKDMVFEMILKHECPYPRKIRTKKYSLNTTKFLN